MNDRKTDPKLIELILTVLDKISSGIIVFSSNGKIVYFNQTAMEILLYENTDSQTKIQELFDHSTLTAITGAMDTGRSIPQVRLFSNINRKDPVTLCGSVTPLSLDEFNFKGGVILVKDLSGIARILEDDSIYKGCYRGIVGNSSTMRQLLAHLPEISAADVPVLLMGKSGTGKELIARAIHEMSPNNRHSFVAVNCGAIPDTLVESELFGYKRGAFTDARHDKKGLLEIAHNGTLFLDEIGNASSAFQMKLLRVLQEGSFVPLGGVKSVKISIRIIAATNADLMELIRENRFRSDLYYRLAVIRFTIPPLKERRQDIPVLINSIIGKIRKRTSKDISGLTLNAMAILYDYDYPGNVRELENILERAFVLCNSQKIDIHHLPDDIINFRQEIHPEVADKLSRHSELTNENERDRIYRVLNENQWSRQKAAEILGIHRATLYRKIKKYHL